MRPCDATMVSIGIGIHRKRHEEKADHIESFFR